MSAGRADGHRWRTAVVSLRAVRQRNWMANLYATEDVLVAGGADLLIVEAVDRPLARLARGEHRAARVVGRAGIRPYHVDADELYDHVVVMVNDVADLQVLSGLDRPISSLARQRTLVQTECWPMDVVWSERLIRAVYAEFDDVFVTIEAARDPLRALHPRVHPLLQFADVSVHPGPQRFDRPVDVINFGRRDDRQHRLLSDWAAANPERWYVHDTGTDSITPDPAVHRRSMARLLANTRVAVCNFAAFPVGERRAGAREAGSRFFEAIAGGCLVLGDLPTSSRFVEAFAEVEGFIDWPIGQHELPAAFHDVVLDDQRRRRVAEQLRREAVERHDVAHRLREIHRTVDVPVPPAVTERISRLAAAG